MLSRAGLQAKEGWTKKMGFVTVLDRCASKTRTSLRSTSTYSRGQHPGCRSAFTADVDYWVITRYSKERTYLRASIHGTRPSIDSGGKVHPSPAVLRAPLGSVRFTRPFGWQLRLAPRRRRRQTPRLHRSLGSGFARLLPVARIFGELPRKAILAVVANEKTPPESGVFMSAARCYKPASHSPFSFAASLPTPDSPVTFRAHARTHCRVAPVHFRNSAMSNRDELDCPKCRTELISCICGNNKMCPRCTFRIVTLPCSCPGGLTEWRFPRTDTMSDFVDQLLPPAGSD